MVAEQHWLRLCGEGEVSPDAPLRCEVDGVAYAVFELESNFFVIADRCTHGPGSLSDGYLDGDEVECPFHRGRFNIRTGRPTAAPCTTPVKTWQVRVSEGSIWIQPAAARTSSYTNQDPPETCHAGYRSPVRADDGKI